MKEQRVRKVRLIPFDQATIQAIDECPNDVERQLRVSFGSVLETIRDVGKQTAALLIKSPRPAPWGAYLATDSNSGEVIGTCAFTDAPGPSGTVEIAYFTFPLFEGRGYATAMAAELLAVADSSEPKCPIIAHTLPEQNASTRVLEKNGFRRVGEATDPDVGAVWRWQRDPRS